MWNKCTVVMLPTNEKAIGVIMLKKSTNKLVTDFHSTRNTTDHFAKEIYILSDEEIKDDDWFLSNLNEILKCTKREDNFVWYEKLTVPGVSKVAQPFSIHINLKPKKIIAATDKSLKITIPRHNDFDSEWLLPQIPQQFIEKYISEYNKGNIITEVMVEYERFKERHGDGRQFFMSERLKINPDNTINIELIDLDLDKMGKEIIEYSKQYEGTNKYDDVMKAIEFGYQLGLKHN